MSETTAPLKPGLEPLPPGMAHLPISSRGYPVPWFVSWIKGEPEFRAADANKLHLAIRDKLCWVCGRKLGRFLVFVVGPMCGVNRTSAEPPCHLDCARYSAKNCPFLTKPQMTRREDETFNNESLVEHAPGIALSRNPGVTLLWATRAYDLMNVPNGVLFCLGEPTSVEWWSEGQKATRDQVVASVTSGLPHLEQLANLDGYGAVQALKKATAALEKLYPV